MQKMDRFFFLVETFPDATAAAAVATTSRAFFS